MREINIAREVNYQTGKRVKNRTEGSESPHNHSGKNAVRSGVSGTELGRSEKMS